LARRILAGRILSGLSRSDGCHEQQDPRVQRHPDASYRVILSGGLLR
jgi:hypothetical protein